MNCDSIPSLAEFLAAPIEEVAKVAPATVVYGVGGTRRQAAFEGIEPWSDAYVKWARACTISQADLLFQHGIRNLLMVAITPGTLKEVTRYREVVFERTKWVMAGEESLSDYQRLGWRVRLLGTEDVPELWETVELLKEATLPQSTHTFYWSVVATDDSPWQQLLAAAQRTRAQSRAEVVRALYGEDIPPVTLYLAFGKPTFLPEIIPPLLMGQIQCYWRQQPGYTLTEEQLRTVLYDYAYLRPTWQAEKLERAKEALAHRQAWEEGPTLGLGMRLGAFWYPAPMSSPAWSAGEVD